MFILRLRYSAPAGPRFLHVDVGRRATPDVGIFCPFRATTSLQPQLHNTLIRPRKSLQLYINFKVPTGRNTPESVYVQSSISIL